MANNPFLDEIERRYDLEDIAPDTLAALAVAQELHEMNHLTAAALTSPRVVLGAQEPLSPEDIRTQMSRTKLMAVPEDSGDARIAAAARRWAEAYGNRNMPGASPATHHLSAAELLEAVRQEGER